MAQLTQKERMILEDEKSQEQLCIEKYSHAADQAECSELKMLFKTLGSQESQHLNTIDGILNGQIPMMGQSGMQQQQGQQGFANSSSGQSQQTSMPNIGNQQQAPKTKGSKKDSMLCHDALSTEKFVSSLYNTGIFEFRDTNIRQALNHIQKEEQEHGEKLFNYMSSHGYYQVQ